MVNWQLIRDRGGLFFVSHSAAKDSQSMLIYLVEDLRVPIDQIVIIPAHLGQIEWEGVIEHIEKYNYGLKVNVVQAVDKQGQQKDFLSMVKHRGMFPSPQYRQCTSDLKTGPIYKFIRAQMKERGISLAVNCIGLRAEESSARSKKVPWKINDILSKAGREVYDWLPIHDWDTDEAFDAIYASGQTPHPAYLDQVTHLAKHPNVAIKWSHAQKLLDGGEYPYPALRPLLRKMIDTFGKERVLWASDNSVIPNHTWSSILYSVKDDPELSQEEKTWILGRSARALLRWPAAN